MSLAIGKTRAPHGAFGFHAGAIKIFGTGTLASRQMAWDALAVYTNAGHMLLCGGSVKLQVKWHPNQTSDGAVKAGLRLLVLGLLRAQLNVFLCYVTIACLYNVGVLLDLLHGCGALVRWRCDARNAEQNIAGLGVP